MAMLLITARRFPRRVRFSVHLDTTRTTTDDKGATVPDPAWVLTQDYELGKGERRQVGETAQAYQTRMAAYLANLRADIKTRCNDRLAELIDETDPGVAMAGEGQAF